MSTRYFTHYVCHSPESEQTNELMRRTAFNETHHPAYSKTLGLSELAALQCVNNWNRQSERYRYWLEH